MVNECTSIDFSKEVCECLVKVMILVRRSDIFEKKVLILVRRCDICVVKECKSIDFTKEVCDFLVKVVIL